MKQTKITNLNCKEFYENLYPQQFDAKQQLIDISDCAGPVLAIDCCGWHYKNLFGRDVLALECLSIAQQCKLSLQKFDKLIDDRVIDKIVWPTVHVDQSTVIMDRSQLLKYKSIKELSILITDIAKKYQPKNIKIRGNLIFIDDVRIADRFYNWHDFKVDNYVIEKFFYDTGSVSFFIELRQRL